MKKAFLLSVTIAILTISSTAFAKMVFVPSAIVPGKGYVPGHWVQIPDQNPYGNSGSMLGDILNYAQRDQERRRQSWRDLSNTLDNLRRDKARRRMKELLKIKMHRPLTDNEKDQLFDAWFDATQH